MAPTKSETSTERVERIWGEINDLVPEESTYVELLVPTALKDRNALGSIAPGALAYEDGGIIVQRYGRVWSIGHWPYDEVKASAWASVKDSDREKPKSSKMRYVPATAKNPIEDRIYGLVRSAGATEGEAVQAMHIHRYLTPEAGEAYTTLLLDGTPYEKAEALAKELSS